VAHDGDQRLRAGGCRVQAIAGRWGKVPPLDTDCAVVVTRARWGPVTLAAGAVLAAPFVTTLLA
jgi:hypothetical protein